jgi:hypothetical protein
MSAYDEGDLVAALECFSLLDVVQVAVSVLDQRLVGSPALAEVRARGGRVQARSVFLRGVALAPADHPLFGHHQTSRACALWATRSGCAWHLRALSTGWTNS